MCTCQLHCDVFSVCVDFLFLFFFFSFFFYSAPSFHFDSHMCVRANEHIDTSIAFHMHTICIHCLDIWPHSQHRLHAAVSVCDCGVCIYTRIFIYIYHSRATHTQHNTHTIIHTSDTNTSIMHIYVRMAVHSATYNRAKLRQQ